MICCLSPGASVSRVLDPEAARQQAAADLLALSNSAEVAAASLVDELPFPDSMQFVTVARTLGPGGGRAAVAWPLRATEGVVGALGLQVTRGRGFAAGERGVALVTNTLAEQLVPGGGGNVIGRRISAEGLTDLSIVGVLRDFPGAPGHGARSAIGAGGGGPGGVAAGSSCYVVRARRGQGSSGGGEAAARIAQVLAPGEVAVRVPDFSAGRTYRISRGAAIVMTWMIAIVVGVALAGALAVTSFSVSERTRQIGVRRALGATRGDILVYFVGENALLTTFGIAVGLAITLPLNVFMTKHNMMPLATWWQVGLAMCLFWAASLVSALGPARRASRIPPTAAIRTI